MKKSERGRNPLQTNLKLRYQVFVACFSTLLISLGLIAAIYREAWTMLLPGVILGAVVSAGGAVFVSFSISRAIYAGVETINKTADEIANTVEQRVRLANQQAAAANQTTVAMEELAASARQSAEQAES